MVRDKLPEADLQLQYHRTLARAMALSGAVHLLLFALIPAPGFRPAAVRQRPLVIQPEPIPPTRQRIPPRFVEPRPVRDESPPVAPPPRVEISPPEVVTEFPVSDEEEAVEMWMVEKPPLVRKRVLPAYPDSAQAALIQGRVAVRVLLGRDGRVERVGRITGPEIFHEVAAAAAKQWEFTPAVQNDQTVRVWVSVPFAFELE